MNIQATFENTNLTHPNLIQQLLPALSDTEVILASYACWGKDCLRHFNGMWAFVIIDTKERKSFISRDRFGVKPLYYYYSLDGVLAFASEIKQFTVLPGWHAGLNVQRSYDFLVWGQLDHTNETMFCNVYQIRLNTKTIS